MVRAALGSWNREHGTHRAVAVPGYWNDTLGAARSVSAVSSSGAFLKPNMPATLTAGKTSRRMLYSVAASLNACRAKAILFSVEVSSSCRASMFWLALRSGYASDRAKSRPKMPPSWASAWLNSLMAAGSLGLAATFCSAAIALLRALMTAGLIGPDLRREDWSGPSHDDWRKTCLIQSCRWKSCRKTWHTPRTVG